MAQSQPAAQQMNVFSTLPTWLRRLLPIVLMLILLSAATWSDRPDGYLHIWFLDTPGDAFLIQTPHGQYILIDGGSDPSQLALQLGRRLPFWRRSLDLVILSQGNGERLPGQVAALMRYHVRLVLSPPDFARTPLSAARADPAQSRPGFEGEWQRLVRTASTPVHAPEHDERLVLDGVVLTLLPVNADGAPGLLLRLDYGSTCVVFNGVGGDLDAANRLIAGAPLTLLAYPWQREMDYTTWQPQAIVFTTAYQADEPALHTYYERAVHGAKLYHQDLDGTVELLSNGRQARILVHR